MNYWLEKRNNKDILLKITLRKMSGETIYNCEMEVFKIGAHVIHLKDLLKMLSFEEKCNEGSIELEFFSKQNLVMPYPALIIRYLGGDWHTSTHSTQRNFSIDSGDTEARINEAYLAEEGNITIQNNTNYDPFFIIHNGKGSLKKVELGVTITSESGEEMISIPINLDWGSFQTRFFILGDLIDFRSFLGDQLGTFKVKFIVSGVFPRIIAGQRSLTDGHWSIDHTNFAATEGPVLDDVFDVCTEPNFKNLVFNVPNNFDDSWECFADIYPTYPDKKYSVEVNIIDLHGQKIKSESLRLEKKSKNALQRIECSDKGNYELIFNHEKSLPKRFHVGVQYKIKSGNYGFLTDGPVPYDSHKITTRWMPLFDTSSCENFILIADRTLGDLKSFKKNFIVKLFNSFGDNPLLSSFDLRAHESKAQNVSDLFENYDKFLNRQTGWVYLTSETPHHCNVHYVSVRSGNSIACDHAF